MQLLPPGGLMAGYPEPLAYLPAGVTRGMIGFNEQMRFPSGVTYNQSKLSTTSDPFRIAVGAIDLRTGKVIDLRQAEAATFADILDGLSPAIFLVDTDGQIVHGNAASRSMLEHGDLLRTVHGRLNASDAQVDQTLHDAFATAGKSDSEMGGKGKAWSLKGRAGERYIAHVLPLSVGERRKAGAASAAVAALFVRKAELETVPPSEVIGKTYKLTPTELRVLRAIVNVGGVRQVAGNLGVADTTVKTHLGRLFEKTGVSRQADLVKLVAGYSSVLVD